jgi:hypothetical protein
MEFKKIGPAVRCSIPDRFDTHTDNINIRFWCCFPACGSSLRYVRWKLHKRKCETQTQSASQLLTLLLCLAFVDFRSYYGEDGERGMNMNKVRVFLQIIYGVVRPSVRGEASKMGTDVHRESFITALTTHNRHQFLLLVQHISWHLINGRVTGACCFSALGCYLL